jgi:hypothetical protein
MGKMTKRSVAIAAAAVVAVGGAGAAYAAWNVDSTANVTVTAGNAAQVAVTATNVTDLYPGASKPVTVTIANPNKFRVKITQITGPVITVNGDAGGCTGNNSGITVTQTLSTPIVLSENSGAQTFTIPNVITMNNNSNTACQGKAFNFAFTLKGESTTENATPGL